MATLKMMCGISGSGKSHYADKLRQKGYEVFSSDELRKELYCDESDQTHNAKVFEEFHKRIVRALKEDKKVVYDATNLSRRRRISFLNLISHIDCYKVITVIAAPIELCVERDAKRSRSVGEKVIWKQVKNFVMPHLGEGWDEIRIERNEQCFGNDLLEFLTGNTPHDCAPYHFEGIEDHMLLAAKKANAQKADQIIVQALMFHDIGKLFTKDFHDAKGNPTDIAHYYSHENVSSYLFLTSKHFQNEDDLVSLYLIQFHMEPYHRKGAAWEKFASTFKGDFIEGLLMMNSFDRAGRKTE